MPVFGLVLWVTIFVIGFIIGLIVLIYIGLKGFRKINKEVNAEFQNRCKWCGAYFESELEVHKPCPSKPSLQKRLSFFRQGVGIRSKAEKKIMEKIKEQKKQYQAKKEQEEKEMLKPGKMPKDWKPEEPDN